MILPISLTNTAQQLVDSGNFAPAGGQSKCNLFVAAFANGVFNYADLAGKTANGIVEYMRSGNGWTLRYDVSSPPSLDDAFSQAQDLANQANLVVIGLKTGDAALSGGHVAVVIPGVVTPSGSWQTAGLASKLPIVAQAGVQVFTGKHLGYGISPASYSSGQFVIYSRV